MPGAFTRPSFAKSSNGTCVTTGDVPPALSTTLIVTGSAARQSPFSNVRRGQMISSPRFTSAHAVMNPPHISPGGWRCRAPVRS